MLTLLDNDENIFRAIKAGAGGYLLKDVTPGESHNALVETMKGGAIMTPSFVLKTVKLFRNRITFDDMSGNHDFNLSAREIEA
ncbi:MAG: hypothetical protein WCR72_06660 [Bacteroidota bacterium]